VIPADRDNMTAHTRALRFIAALCGVASFGVLHFTPCPSFRSCRSSPANPSVAITCPGSRMRFWASRTFYRSTEGAMATNLNLIQRRRRPEYWASLLAFALAVGGMACSDTSPITGPTAAPLPPLPSGSLVVQGTVIAM